MFPARRAAWWLGWGVLAGLLAQPSRAQTMPKSNSVATCGLSLAGRVADYEVGTVLPGTTMRLLETGEVSATGPDGNYHSK